MEWNVIPPEDMNGVLIGYKVFYEELNGFHYTWNVSVSFQNSSVVLRDLRKYTNYTIRVQGLTRVGGGNLSESITCSTAEDGKYDLWNLVDYYCKVWLRRLICWGMSAWLEKCVFPTWLYKLRH